MNRGHFRSGHFRSTGNRRHRDGLHGNTNGPSSSNFGGHSGNNRSRRSYNPRCQIYKIEGHTADRCQNRYDRAEPSAHIAETFPSCTSDWYLDTGASAHMMPDSTTLTTSEQYVGKDKVIVGNGAPLPITHTGTSQPSPNLKLLDVLLVPHLTKNLLSISKLTKDFPLLVTFNDSSFIIQNKITRTVVATGRCDDGLHVLERGNVVFIFVLNKSVLAASYDLWHARLGHVNHSIISLLNKKGHLSLTSILPNPAICATCQIAKSHKLSFSSNNTRSNSILGLIHCDIWGPATIKSKMGFAYYMIFVDDHSRFTWLYPMKFKSDFIDIFLQYQIFVENQYSCKIKNFQSDGGAEFCSNRFQSQLRSSGIQHQKSCPYTRSQNGCAERKHRHVTEMGLALLFPSRVSTYYWVDAFSTMTYIINRLPTQLLAGLSPFEILHGKAPLYINFHPFGYRVYPCLRDYAANKFSPRSIPCIFLGYSPSYKGYRCLDPLTSKIYVTPHAKFDELNFPLIPNSHAQSPASLDLSSFSELMHAHDPPLSTAPLPTVPLSNPHSRSRSHACCLCSDSLLEPMQVSTDQMSSTQHTSASSEAPDPPTQAPLHSEAQAHHHDQSAASSSHSMVT